MMGAWSFTDHALSRGASRVGLIMDEGVRSAISRTLDSDDAVFLSVRRRGHLFEIPLLGVRVIAVCNVQEKVVITFLDAKKWWRSQNNRTRRHWRPEASGEEE